MLLSSKAQRPSTEPLARETGGMGVQTYVRGSTGMRSLLFLGLLHDDVAPNICGHDHHRVLEIHSAALRWKEGVAVG